MLTWNVVTKYLESDAFKASQGLAHVSEKSEDKPMPPRVASCFSYQRLPVWGIFGDAFFFFQGKHGVGTSLGGTQG